jgi:hypothetical protein
MRTAHCRYAHVRDYGPRMVSGLMMLFQRFRGREGKQSNTQTQFYVLTNYAVGAVTVARTPLAPHSALPGLVLVMELPQPRSPIKLQISP